MSASATGSCPAGVATAGARGDLAAAEEAITEALLEHQRVDVPIELGRALLVDGQLRRRRREKVGARDSFEHARTLFERAGAVLWLQRANEELDRVGRRRRDGELTVTESRVAALVAEGRSNRQIADALFISRKTVEANLSRVFRALDVRSRAELAARWRRQPVPQHTAASTT